MPISIFMRPSGNLVVYTTGDVHHSAEITLEEFTELMVKAQSKCSRSPANMMKFLDIVIHKEPQQDYNSMDIYNVSTSSPDTEGRSDI